MYLDKNKLFTLSIALNCIMLFYNLVSVLNVCFIILQRTLQNLKHQTNWSLLPYLIFEKHNTKTWDKRYF